MKKTEIGTKGARPAINEEHLRHVVGGAGKNSYVQFCEKCQVSTPHTPTASGSYSCNVCGYDPAKKSDN